MANTHEISLEADNNEAVSWTTNPHDPGGTADFSVEMWIKPQTLPSTTGVCHIIYDQAGSGGNPRFQFQITKSGDGACAGSTDDTVVAWLRNAGSSAELTLESTTTLTAGTCYHIAFVRNGNDFFLYINGTQEATANSALGSMDFDADDAQLGRNAEGSKEYDGAVDDLRFWSDARTASEIDDNKDAELDGTEAGLVAYYKFNNDATDSAGTNDGTEENTPTYNTSGLCFPAAGAAADTPTSMGLMGVGM